MSKYKIFFNETIECFSNNDGAGRGSGHHHQSGSSELSHASGKFL